MKEKTIELGHISLENYYPTDKLFSDWNGILPLDGNEVVLEGEKDYVLKIDYPLSVPYIQTGRTPSCGVTRRELIGIIVDAYRAVYAMEDKTSGVPADHMHGMYNRNTTDGTYGIWGHDIGDLDLHSAYISKGGVITLGVDS
jgi:hypothetical protein